MKNYDFKRRSLFSGPHLLGSILIAAGILSIVSPAVLKFDSSLERSLYIGAVAIILGLLIVSSYGGVLIDFNKKRVKDYFSFLGFRFGKWESLPTIMRIKVISARHKITNTPNGISPTWSGTVTDHKVFLYAESSSPVLSFIFQDKARALKAAQLLSANLNSTCEVKEM